MACCWVAAALHLLLLCNAAATARAAVALFAVSAGNGTRTVPMPPRLSLAETTAAAGTGDYDDGTTGDKGSREVVGSPIVAGAMNKRLKALTSSFAAAIGKKLDYCIKDTEAEWNMAFDFSKDTTFLSNCMKETKGDLQQRICTAAEMGFYFDSVMMGGSDMVETNYVRPNINQTAGVTGKEDGPAYV